MFRTFSKYVRSYVLLSRELRSSNAWSLSGTSTATTGTRFWLRLRGVTVSEKNALTTRTNHSALYSNRVPYSYTKLIKCRAFGFLDALRWQYFYRIAYSKWLYYKLFHKFMEDATTAIDEVKRNKKGCHREKIDHSFHYHGRFVFLTFIPFRCYGQIYAWRFDSVFFP